MNISAKDRERLNHIWMALEAIEKYTTGFTREQWQAEQMRNDATLCQLEIVGEASNQLSQELLDLSPEIPWHSVAGFRNIVVHEYFRVDQFLVWNIIQYNLPVLKMTVAKLLDKI